MRAAIRGSHSEEDRATDGQAAEPLQGTPNSRALGAMESAVRRAQRQPVLPGCPLPSLSSGRSNLFHPKRARWMTKNAIAGSSPPLPWSQCRSSLQPLVSWRRSPPTTAPERGDIGLDAHDAGPRWRFAFRPTLTSGRGWPLDRAIHLAGWHDRQHGGTGVPGPPVLSMLNPSGTAGMPSRSRVRTSSARTARLWSRSTVRWHRRAVPRRTSATSRSRPRQALRPRRRRSTQQAAPPMRQPSHTAEVP
jgi:hypothetical protein